MPEKAASKKEQTTLVAERKRPLERLAGGVMLCGWGVAKLAADGRSVSRRKRAKRGRIEPVPAPRYLAS